MDDLFLLPAKLHRRHRSPGGRRHSRRRLRMEPLEDRRLLNVDLGGAVLEPAAEGEPNDTVYRALVIGIAHYETIDDLDYCDNDAVAFHDALLQDAAHWQASNVTLLVDSQATQSAIQTALADMAAASDADDVCVIFFAGHGGRIPTDVDPIDESDGMDEYLCPYDAGTTLDSRILDDEFSQWVGEISAASISIFLDACYSGGQVEVPLTLPAGPAPAPTPESGDGFAADLFLTTTNEDGSSSTGNIVFVAACGEEERSYGSPEAGHGVFTACLLDALASPLTDTNGDGLLSAEEVYRFLEPRATAHFNPTATVNERQHGQIFDGITGEADFLTAPPAAPTTILYENRFDADPGWSTDSGWTFGTPTGATVEYGAPDPTGGFTGSSVYGFNLDGSYPHSISESYLTTTAIDCSNSTDTRLRFYRWLGVESGDYDRAAVEVSNDGTNWTTVWQNTFDLSDLQWILCDCDISAVADGQSTVYLRWQMGPTDDGWNYCGWNIDDVRLLGNMVTETRLNGIAPGQGGNAETERAATVTGQGFFNGVSIRLLRDGQTPIDAENLVVADSETITCTFDLTGAESGPWDVQLVLPGGGTDTLDDAFTVYRSGSVLGRYVYYPDSAWGDEIAPDKQPLVPGLEEVTSTLANVISHPQGIRGIYIDVVDPLVEPTTDDFAFHVGGGGGEEDIDPATWTELAVAPTVTVTPGAGVGGSDRIALQWPAGAIRNTWLEVKMFSTGEVFYFASVVGETTDPVAGVFQVDAGDLDGARDNPKHAVFDSAAIDFVYDLNRDQAVDIIDYAIVRDNPAGSSNGVRVLTLPAASPAPDSPAPVAVSGEPLVPPDVFHGFSSEAGSIKRTGLAGDPLLIDLLLSDG